MADIWPAWLAVVRKGDHNHNPLWPLLSFCNRYQTGPAHFQISSHLKHIPTSFLTFYSNTEEDVKKQSNGSPYNISLSAFQTSYSHMPSSLHLDKILQDALYGTDELVWHFVETIIKVNEKHQNAPIVNPIYHAAWSHFTTGVGLTGIKGGRGRRSQWVMQGRAWPISMWHAKSSKSH